MKQLLAKKESLSKELKEIFREVTGTPVHKINLKSNLRQNLDIDSFAITEILVVLESKYRIKIQLNELLSINTFDDVIGLVLGKIKK